MKKTTLSTLLIVLFTGYAIFQRMSGPATPQLGSVGVLSSGQSSGSSSTLPSPTPTDVTQIEATPTPTAVPTTVPTSTTIGASPTPTPVPTPRPTPLPTPTPVIKPKGQYVDGTYTGVSADAYYGNIQVQAVISGGKITDVIFLDHPQDRSRSISINNYAMPRLTQEAIAAQSANVNIVSGATDSSQAFQQSLASALTQAKS